MSDDLSKVDWTRPIEAVHGDGTVVPMRFDRKIWDQGVWLWQTTWHPADNSNENWEEDGSDCVPNSGWRIRNVAEPKGLTTNETLPPVDIAKRMETLVRRIADTWPGDEGYEARAIVALLPEPVDADEQWAIEQVAAHGYSDRRRPDQRTLVEIMTACVQHGRTRALERDSREG